MDNKEIDIKNLQFTSEDTGSFFSKTYTEYKWKFTLDGIQRTITLNHSKILGKRTIFLGNQEICRYQRYTYSFQYAFPLDVHNISITQNDDTYTLKIDEVPFNRLLNEEKLKRFNIIKETFLEKEKAKKDRKKKDREIRKFRTFNKSGGIPVSLRTNDKRNIYRTNIYSSNREIEENLNIDNENEINTSSKRNNIDNSNNIRNDIDEEEKEIENENQKEIILNPGQYEYYYDEESSEDLSNKAIDGGDSDKDEDEDEEDTDDKTIQESFRPPEDDIFKIENNLDDNDDEEELGENEEYNIKNEDEDENNIVNDNKDDNEDEKDEEDQKDKKNKNISNYNKINNELEPIKSNKKEKHLKKIKIESKKDKKKNKNRNKNNSNNINNIENDIKNDNDINNINNDNNIDNINNDDINTNNIDLLGEEIYNSSRDKDLYNNNVNNNLKY